MSLFDSWADVPKGLCLIRMFHASTGEHVLHLQMKLNDGPWYDNPHVPAYSGAVPGNREFWTWAEENLPIYNYPDVVKSHG